MYDFDKVSEAMLILFDNLQSDDQSSEIIDLIDGAESDADLKKGIVMGLERLRAINKEDVALEVENKTKGFI